MNETLARSLGLLAALFEDTLVPFWVVEEAKSGRELGTWVPHTGSARVGSRMHKGVGTGEAALRLYGELVAKGEKTR